MDLESLRQAVMGAQNIQAPASPLGASDAPELAQLYRTDFQLPQSTQATGALAQGTADLVKAQQEAAARAASASSGGGGGGRRSGGGGYSTYAKKDGGFGFKDPNGNEISVSEYAAAVGKSVDSILKGSKNPIDIQFLKDHKQVQQYINDKLIAKTDAKARSRAQSVETQVRKLYGIPLHQQTPDSLVNTFMQAYPTIYGQGSTYSQGITTGFGNQAGKQGTGRLIPGTSNNKNKSSSPYGGVTNRTR